MKNKKIYLLALLLLVCILSISTISAAENTTKENVMSANNNQETNVETINQYEDVSISDDNSEINLKENNYNDKESESKRDKTTTTNEDSLNFNDLNRTINDNTNSTIYLSNNYKFDNNTDSRFKEGILINRNLKIFGNGITIDGNNMARIFKVDDRFTVEFHDITFINGKAKHGGAIYYGNAYNCTFTNNTANDTGGAIYHGNAYNCLFTNNNAYRGGAIVEGNAYNSTFTNNNALLAGGGNGGAIADGNAYNSNFTNNKAGTGGAIHSGNAINCTFTNNSVEDWYGGAIYRGTAYNSNFTNNKAKKGGAIYEGNAYNSTFTNNTANEGGAIYQGNVTNCTFTNNNATDQFSGGGAIYQGNAYNSTFTNNTAYVGGAIYQGNVTNCTFTNNNATNRYYGGGAICNGTAYNSNFTNNNAEKGGAIYGGNATNCTFFGNNATQGEAMNGGNAILCIFNEDTTYNTTIIPAIINVINYTSVYGSGERFKFNLTANDMKFDGLNTTIKIYKDGSLVTTVYGLTGEGWIVDLIPGEYTAELSLTDYPDEKPSNATITVLKHNTTVVINNITNIKVGDEVTITYNTNSNATATIKVNGTPITDGKFTPIKEGIYNVTIEIEENDYYTAATNQTTLTVEKTNTTILISPIIDYVVGETIPITFTTNSNATATIKVNGQIIPDGNFTPTKAGTYNLTIEIEENDYYTQATEQTTFTVEKTNTTILISPIIDYNIGETIPITFTTNSNATATIKVNGQIIPDGNFTPTKAGTYNLTIEIEENDYYTQATEQTTFTVEKINTTILISPITDYFVGKTIPITFTTNSNATATIKVNGQIIPDGNFTPTKPGTYNITVEIAENDYYKAATNQTAFTIEKTETLLLIAPIYNVNIGQEVIITYLTNSNGTATIKVNGTPITDGKFTPTKAGTYNITVEIAENDYYKVATNQTTLTVEKTETLVLIAPISNVNVGQEVIITYLTNSNGTATIKVNGTPITDDKFTPTKPGTYNITVEIAENDYYKEGNYLSSFEVGKAESKISANPVTTTYNVDKNLVLTLKDSNGKAIKGAVLTVNLGSSKNYTTDDNGQVKINVATLTPKTYNAKITYNGSDIYKGSTSSVKVTVKKATPKITAKAANYKLKVTTKKYTINLKDNENNALKNTKVSLKVNGKTYSVKTNSKGQGVFKITNLKKKGTYTAIITVPANTYYNKISKNVKITVKA